MITNRSIFAKVGTTKSQEEVDELEKKIQEEKVKENPDKIKILKMEEAKIYQNLFSNVFGGQCRFRNPW